MFLFSYVAFIRIWISASL